VCCMFSRCAYCSLRSSISDSVAACGIKSRWSRGGSRALQPAGDRYRYPPVSYTPQGAGRAHVWFPACSALVFAHAFEGLIASSDS
jgi:hypothetical protein